MIKESFDNSFDDNAEDYSEIYTKDDDNAIVELRKKINYWMLHHAFSKEWNNEPIGDFITSNICEYVINDDNTIDTISDCYIGLAPFGWNGGNMGAYSIKTAICIEKELPKFINFNHAHKNFICDCNKLETLRGCPKIVDGEFSCADQSESISLLSLKGAPQEVGSFLCHHNYALKNLIGGPKIVHKGYDCSFCYGLTSLEGAPEIVPGEFSIVDYGEHLHNFIGGPKCVGGLAIGQGNGPEYDQFTSLDGLPEVKYFIWNYSEDNYERTDYPFELIKKHPKYHFPSKEEWNDINSALNEDFNNSFDDNTDDYSDAFAANDDMVLRYSKKSVEACIGDFIAIHIIPFINEMQDWYIHKSKSSDIASPAKLIHHVENDLPIFFNTGNDDIDWKLWMGKAPTGLDMFWIKLMGRNEPAAIEISVVDRFFNLPDVPPNHTLYKIKDTIKSIANDIFQGLYNELYNYNVRLDKRRYPHDDYFRDPNYAKLFNPDFLNISPHVFLEPFIQKSSKILEGFEDSFNDNETDFSDTMSNAEQDEILHKILKEINKWDIVWKKDTRFWELDYENYMTEGTMDLGFITQKPWLILKLQRDESGFSYSYHTGKPEFYHWTVYLKYPSGEYFKNGKPKYSRMELKKGKWIKNDTGTYGEREAIHKSREELKEYIINFYTKEFNEKYLRLYQVNEGFNDSFNDDEEDYTDLAAQNDAEEHELRRRKITTWLETFCHKYNEFGFPNYTINPDDSIDIDEQGIIIDANFSKANVKDDKGNIISVIYVVDINDDIAHQQPGVDITNLCRLPSFIQFNECKGNFGAMKLGLTSMRGFPRKMTGHYPILEIGYNNLTTFDYCPKFPKEGWQIGARKNMWNKNIPIKDLHIPMVIMSQDIQSKTKDYTLSEIRFDWARMEFSQTASKTDGRYKKPTNIEISIPGPAGVYILNPWDYTIDGKVVGKKYDEFNNESDA